MKLILGTANFGQNYGLKQIRVKNREIRKILNICKKKNIKQIDTAYNYGITENLLGSNKTQKFKICTKIPKLPSSIRSNKIAVWIKNIFFKSLKNLKIKKIDTVIFHNTSQFKNKKGRIAYNVLQNLKKKGFVKKIGYSIYSPKELDMFFNDFKPDIIEVPYNILDRRIKISGWLKKLHKKKVKVWARSIFLQGLLLFEKKSRPKFFNKWKNLWKIWDKLILDKKTALEICMIFILKERYIDKFIVGVNHSNELLEILNIIKKNCNKIYIKKLNKILKKINIKDKKILEPFRWQKI